MSATRYPTVADVRLCALERIPAFARAFVESGTGDDLCTARNTARFTSARLVPRYLVARAAPDTSAHLFGLRHSLPVAVAPIGLASVIWPGAERRLAQAARSADHPFCLSTIASMSIEEAGDQLGPTCWFQLYPTKDKAVQTDLLDRCRAAGIETIVVTVDVPVHNRREGLSRAGLSMPLRFSPRLALQALRTPRWLLSTLAAGPPRPVNLIRYVGSGASVSEEALFAFLSEQFGNPTDEADLRAIRDRWPGTLIVKGIMTAADARLAVDAGADGLVVSNHGGRQLDVAPHPLDVLPDIRHSVGGLTLLLDSGLRSGGDVAIALAHGADFVMMGRAFLYGAAAGPDGADRVSTIVAEGLANVMAQLGCETLSDLRDRIPPDGTADQPIPFPTLKLPAMDNRPACA